MKSRAELSLLCAILICCLATGLGQIPEDSKFAFDFNTQGIKQNQQDKLLIPQSSGFPPADVDFKQQLPNLQPVQAQESSVNPLTKLQGQQNPPTNLLSDLQPRQQTIQVDPTLTDQQYQQILSSSQQDYQQLPSQQWQQISSSSQQDYQPIPLTAQQPKYQQGWQQQQQNQLPSTSQHQQEWQQLSSKSLQTHNQQEWQQQKRPNEGIYYGNGNKFYQDGFMYYGDGDTYWSPTDTSYHNSHRSIPHAKHWDNMGYGNQNFYGYGDLPYNQGFIQYRYPVSVPYHHSYGQTGSKSVISDDTAMMLDVIQIYLNKPESFILTCSKECDYHN